MPLFVMVPHYKELKMHRDQPEEYVPYLNRSVPRRGFRTMIYASDGREKLAESYDEFDAYIHSDTWFATKDEALAASKPIKRKNKEVKEINEYVSE